MVSGVATRLVARLLLAGLMPGSSCRSEGVLLTWWGCGTGLDGVSDRLASHVADVGCRRTGFALQARKSPVRSTLKELQRYVHLVGGARRRAERPRLSIRR